MTTSFSFAGTHAWAKKGPLGAVEKLGLLQRAQARWQSWRDGREQQRMRRRLEETRISGRKPVNQLGANAASSEPQGTIQLGDESDIFETEEKEEKSRDSRKPPILFLHDEKKEKVAEDSVIVVQSERDSPLDDAELLRDWEVRRYGRNQLLIWQRAITEPVANV